MAMRRLSRLYWQSLFLRVTPGQQVAQCYIWRMYQAQRHMHSHSTEHWHYWSSTRCGCTTCVDMHGHALKSGQSRFGQGNEKHCISLNRGSCLIMMTAAYNGLPSSFSLLNAGTPTIAIILEIFCCRGASKMRSSGADLLLQKCLDYNI